ncbi:DUF551 domain-containing protein [Acinetobacter oleivorans]|uniref:DUF551 domain-containing protein n=1 Tax=Acinetobacter oleivorans TaxID=1148157 RepID=UPI0012304656|nr:DUF551 domain-containing protein [Acinetobacter oleivorans]
MTLNEREKELELFNAFVKKELPELFEKYSSGNFFAKVTYDSMFGAWLGAKAQAVPIWISVKDEEPPTDTMVLICWSNAPDVQPESDYMTCDEDLNHIWANFYRDPPTHWMHFHKVPSESGAEE